MKQADKPLARDIIDLMLECTKVDTMTKIYKRLRPGPDSRIRTEQAPATETGRLNSKDSGWFTPERFTNLQNLPNTTAKADPLYDARGIILTDPGYVLLFADYSQAELYAYLAFAGDWERVEALEAGEDLHSAIAAKIYGVSVDEVDKRQRTVGKFANYSLGYAGGWSMFLSKVNQRADLTGVSITAAEAKQAVNVWRADNVLTVRWWDAVKDEVAQTGHLTNPYGRRRDFLSQHSAGNDIIAHLPQSTVADHVNTSLRLLHERADPELLHVLLQVHDEIIVRAPYDGIELAAQEMRSAMERPVKINGRAINIPVDVSVSEGTWADKQAITI